MLKWAYCSIMHYNISLAVAKKLLFFIKKIIHIRLTSHLHPRATTQVRLTSHLHPNPKCIRFMGHLTYMFVTIFSYIKSETLTHIRHVSISPFKCKTLGICDLVTKPNKIRWRYSMVKMVSWWWFNGGRFMFLSFMRSYEII